MAATITVFTRWKIPSGSIQLGVLADIYSEIRMLLVVRSSIKSGCCESVTYVPSEAVLRPSVVQTDGLQIKGER
jgi:hypothetical protein